MYQIAMASICAVLKVIMDVIVRASEQASNAMTTVHKASSIMGHAEIHALLLHMRDKGNIQ